MQIIRDVSQSTYRVLYRIREIPASSICSLPTQKKLPTCIWIFTALTAALFLADSTVFISLVNDLNKRLRLTKDDKLKMLKEASLIVVLSDNEMIKVDL